MSTRSVLTIVGDHARPTNKNWIPAFAGMTSKQEC
jgi:hypothetical protein